MRAEIKWLVYVIGLGMSLVSYAHITFATKGLVDLIYDRLKIMDDRIYEIHKITVEKNK